MTNEQFINILSLQMVQVKMTMQLMAYTLKKEQYNEWERLFNNIDKEFERIVESYIK